MVNSHIVEMIARLILASILGGIIGFEREIHGRPAGFRTHLLVSLGSCLFVVSSIEFYKVFGDSSVAGVDPGRVAAQVVTGIGFLGAGAIIREKASVRGLTTAACLWVASAIGLACGIGMFTIAFSVMVIALISLLLLKKVENLLSRDIYASLMIWGVRSGTIVTQLEKLLEECDLQILKTRYEMDVEDNKILIEYNVRSTTKGIPLRIVEIISAVEGVKKVRIT